MPRRYLLSEPSAAIVRELASRRGGVDFDPRRIAPPSASGGGGGAFPAVVVSFSQDGVYSATSYRNGIGAPATGAIHFATTERSPQSAIPAGSVVLVHDAPYVGAEDGNQAEASA